MQLALGVAGAIVGSAFGPVGAQIGFLIGSAIGGLLDPPKQQGPRLTDLTLQRSEYGSPIAWVRGIVRLAGQVIWQTDLVEHEHHEGGKGGGGGATTYTYSASFAVLLCEGPITGIRRIWADGRVIWQGGDPTPEVPFTLYLGDSTQDPDPTMEADPDIGVGNVPDYRGYAYIVFADMPLEDYNNRIPNLEFEVEATGQPTIARVSTFAVTAGYPIAGQGNNGGLSVAPFDGAYIDGDQVVVCHYEADGPTSRYVEYRRNLYTGVLEDTSAVLSVPNVNDTASQYDYIYGVNSNIAYGLQRGGALHPSRWYVAGVRGAAPVTPPVGTDEYRACVSRPVKHGDFVYAVGGNSLGTTTFVAKWAFVDGSTISPTPEAEYYNVFANQSGTSTSISAANCSVSLGDDGFLYVVNPTAYGVTVKYDLTKVDPTTMSKVKQWTVDSSQTRVYSALAQGVNSNSNIAVVRGLLVVNNLAASPDQLGLWQIPNSVSDPFVEIVTPTVPNTAFFSGTSPLVWLTGGYVLGNDGVYVISGLDDLAAVNAAILEYGQGLDFAQYNVSDLAGIPVRGFKLGSVMSKRNAIEELRKAYPYGVAEVDGKVTARLLNHDPDGAVADGDLGAFNDGADPPSRISWELTNDLELPRRVTIRYIDCDNDYQAGAAEALCDSSIATAETVFDLALVLTQAEAMRLAQNYIARAFVERSRATFRVPRPYLAMAPLDVWTVDGYNLRVESTSWAPGDVIEVTARRTHPAIFDIASTATTAGSGGGSGGGTTTRRSLSLTESVLLDIPLLLPTHSLFGFYWAAGPQNSAQRWPGATLYRSRDDGTTYEVAATKSTPDIIGAAQGALANYAGALTSPDTTHTVTVRLTRSDATLESVTDAALANGANLCALRSGTGWEILQFRDVTLVSPQTYQLSHLMRGRLDSDDRMATHAVGDMFVLLPVTNVDAPESDLNVPLLYKAVTSGAAFSSASWVTFTNTGEGADNGGGSGGAAIARHLPIYRTAHTGTTYTFVEADRGQIHTFANAATVTVTCPAGLKDGWWVFVENIGAGNVVIDPANNLDGGAGSLTLTTNQGCFLQTDGTDYTSLRGVGAGGGGGSLVIKDEGVTLTSAATSIDFLGASITASHLGAGAVSVQVVQTIHTLDGGVEVDADADTLNANAPISMLDAGGGVTNLVHDNSGVTAATYGSATKIPQVTVNATGHVTAAAEVSIASQAVRPPLTQRMGRWMQPNSFNSSAQSQQGLNFGGNGFSVGPTTIANTLGGQWPTLRIVATTVQNAFNTMRATDMFVFRGNAAGVGGWYWRMNFYFESVATQARIALGLLNSTSATGISSSTTPSALIDCAFFGFDQGDTNWQFMVNDASGTCTKTDLGSNFPAQTADRVYVIESWCDGNNADVYYSMTNVANGNVASGSLSSNLPTNTTGILPFFFVGGNTAGTASATTQVGLYRVYLENGINMAY